MVFAKLLRRLRGLFYCWPEVVYFMRARFSCGPQNRRGGLPMLRVLSPRSFVFAGVLLAVINSGAIAQEAPANIGAIETQIQEFMAKERVPGLSAALVLDKKLVWTKGFGFADLENEVPAKAETVYRLASISKMLTATAVLQLVEQGKLDLAAPIQQYCKDFPEKAWPITMRDLLCHQSGIRHYKLPETRSTEHYPELKASLDQFKNDPLLFEPGTKYSYTTYGYCVVGCIVEDVSEMSFTDYMQKNVFDPAGMKTIQKDDPFKLIKWRAQGYRKPMDPKAPMVNSWMVDVTNKVPGGGFSSTAADLAKFAIAIMDRKLLKQETLDRMWTDQTTKDGKATGAGFGSFFVKRGETRVIFHTGGQPRVSTILGLEPSRGYALALMCNLERAPLENLAMMIANLTESE
jgi:serine beta-lactamase-like protein LACTB